MKNKKKIAKTEAENPEPEDGGFSEAENPESENDEVIGTENTESDDDEVIGTENADSDDDETGDDETGDVETAEAYTTEAGDIESGDIEPVHNRRLMSSILAALIGVLIGPLPVVLIAYFSGLVYYPLFVIAPLLAYLFNSLLKGRRKTGASIVITIFSLAGAYITALACQAALYTASYSMPIYRIPYLVYLMFGKSGVIPESASAYAYPLVFTVLGICVIWELLRGRRNVRSEAGENGEESAEESKEYSAENVEKEAMGEGVEASAGERIEDYTDEDAEDPVKEDAEDHLEEDSE